MDVGRCELRGQSLAWLSPTGVVGPWYSEPMGLGWFRSWGGGMVVTCGLDHTLLGGVDDASQFHQLVRPTEEYGCMGGSASSPRASPVTASGGKATNVSCTPRAS